MDDYREKMDLQYLPGLPIPSDPSLMPASNDLHAMKSKVTINLVLNNDVSSEKESILKNVLTSKLHLDEASGDSIIMTRAKLPDADAPQGRPQLLPEFSWKTWALILLLGVMSLAAFVFWLNARKNAKDELASEQAPELPLTAAADTAEENKEPVRNYDQELTDLKDQLLFMVSQYPQTASKTISEMLNNEEEDVIRVFEHLSWDLSRKLFSNISARVWGKLGLKVKDRKQHPTAQDYCQSFELVYRRILSKFLESGAEKDQTNPFDFVFKATQHERKQLLGNEPATTFAMISLYAESEELQILIECADKDVQDKIPGEISKLQTLPESVVDGLATKLRETMRQIKQAPSVSANGPMLAAKILRSYSAEREVEVFAKMKVEDPQSAENLRRCVVLFEDLKTLPSRFDFISLGVNGCHASGIQFLWCKRRL